MNINKKFWKNKKVLITGHTGFKGGWLTVLLHTLQSNINGYALNPEGNVNFFNRVKINKLLNKDLRKDITNFKSLKKSINEIKPEIIFHLAAQSSVIESFKNPSNTVYTNTIGTTNLLEAVKDKKFVKSVIIITTDKVYQNYRKKTYFDENSILGGDDVYSSSKASCEIIVNSYVKSFFFNSNCNIATVRAGNCFGGGDWTKDRIVKDSLESFYNNKKLVLRKPNATRPWQHVIEPLVGYLLLAQNLSSKNGKKFVGPWNFGPSKVQNKRVIDLVKIIKKKLNSKSKIFINKKDKRFKNKKINVFESKDLGINSKKAFKYLKWKPFLSIEDAVDLTVEWYIFHKKNYNLLRTTKKQIENYLNSFI